MHGRIWAKLETLKKTTWIPKTKDGDGGPTDSKFSGIPWLAQDESWPTCPNCRMPMQLFLQLNLETAPGLPEGLERKGLFQIFYCTNADPCCEVECEAFFPFAVSVLLRVVNPHGISGSPAQSPVPNAFPPKTILDWKRQDDYPNWEEREDLGVSLSDEEAEAIDIFPHIGEKLMGWPTWVQGVEYPDCPNCGETMRFLFQIDSEHNLPYMFGDAGCGHITFCANHPERMAFSWACY